MIPSAIAAIRSSGNSGKRYGRMPRLLRENALTAGDLKTAGGGRSNTAAAMSSGMTSSAKRTPGLWNCRPWGMGLGGVVDEPIRVLQRRGAGVRSGFGLGEL